MNVILNADEAQVVLSLVTSTVLDHVEVSEETREKVREYRRERAAGTSELEEFTVALNEAIGNFIDERTRRMMRVRGKVKVQGSR